VQKTGSHQDLVAEQMIHNAAQHQVVELNALEKLGLRKTAATNEVSGKRGEIAASKQSATDIATKRETDLFFASAALGQVLDARCAQAEPRQTP
jgi:2-hydroxy-3-keto-5-methylthiopentenyl-1-phosphate phosphatase